MMQPESPTRFSWIRPFSAFPEMRVPEGAVCRWGNNRVGVALKPDWEEMFSELRGLGPLNLTTGNLCVQTAVHALYPMLNHNREAGLARSVRGDYVLRPGEIAAAYAVEECVDGEFFYSVDLFRKGGHCLQRAQLSPDSDPLRWPLLIGSFADAMGSASIPAETCRGCADAFEDDEALAQAWAGGLCDAESIFWNDDFRPGPRLSWLPRLGKESARRFPVGLVSDFFEYLLGLDFAWRVLVLNDSALSLEFAVGEGPRFFCKGRKRLCLGAQPYSLHVDCRLLTDAWLVRRSDGKLALELYGEGSEPAAVLRLSEFNLSSLPSV